MTDQLCKMLTALEGYHFSEVIFGTNAVSQNTNDIYITFDTKGLIYSVLVSNLHYKDGSFMIHSFSSLSYDRSKASSKSSSPHSAI